MKKVFLALAAAATIAFSTVAAPTTADARCHGPCAVGLGILGAAAIIGTAAAVANSPAYAYPRDYYPVAGYDRFEYNAAPGYACPGGYWAHRVRRDGFGNVVGYGRPRFFCPY